MARKSEETDLSLQEALKILEDWKGAVVEIRLGPGAGGTLTNPVAVAVGGLQAVELDGRGVPMLEIATTGGKTGAWFIDPVVWVIASLVPPSIVLFETVMSGRSQQQWYLGVQQHRPAHHGPAPSTRQTRGRGDH